MNRTPSLVTCLLSLLFAASAASAGTLVYLDFGGHSDPNYPGEGPLTVAPFTGSATSVQTIVARVREDYAPFQVTFTLNEPATIDSGRSDQIRVAVGGSTSDLGGRSGLATSPLQRNTVWAVEFTSNGRRSDRDIANTISHELGHAFGHLAHSQPYATLATYVSHYHARTGAANTNPLAQASHNLVSQGKTQIMGGPRAAVRDIWWKDSHVAKALRAGGDPGDPQDWDWSWQDDILSLAAALGLRADDHGDWPTSGTGMRLYPLSLPPHETRVVGNGVVEMNGASWPGMCPPLPLWQSCPSAAQDDDGAVSEGPTASNGTVDWGQGVVFALARDFFRFDLPAIHQPTSYVPRIEVTVETINRQRAGVHDANLDVDLEIWFNDAVNGWTDITATGSRRDAAGDLWAGWSRTGNGMGLGEYAVAVKSAGAYGDLGHYTVAVKGTRGLVVEPPPRDGWKAHDDGRYRFEELLAMVEVIYGLRHSDELALLLASVAEEGASKRTLERFRERAAEPAKAAFVILQSAMRQTSPLRVVSEFVDWSAMNEKERNDAYERLVRALEAVEHRRAAPGERNEETWSRPDQLGSRKELCDSVLVVE